MDALVCHGKVNMQQSIHTGHFPSHEPSQLAHTRRALDKSVLCTNYTHATCAAPRSKT